METVLGDLGYCPFTVHFTPKFGYIQLKGLNQAKTLTESKDSRIKGFLLTR